MKSWFGIILLCLSVLTACTKSNFCIVPTAARVQCVFSYRDSDNNRVDTNLDRISIVVADTSFIYGEDEENVTAFSIFPNPRSNAQQIILTQETAPFLIDTILIRYKRNTNFISNGCGYETVYELETASSTQRFIKGVNISSALISSQTTEENLELYIQ